MPPVAANRDQHEAMDRDRRQQQAAQAEATRLALVADEAREREAMWGLDAL